MAGTVIGVARMVAGAHFLTDVLVAAAISLGTAAFLAPWVERVRHVSRWLLVGVLAVAGAGFVWFNHFTVALVYDGKEPYGYIDLPCHVDLPPAGQPLRVTVRGYGAPVS